MTESGAAGDWYLEKARGYGFVPEVIAMKSNSDHFKNYVHVVELWPDEGTVTDDGDWYAATKAMIANLQQEVVERGLTLILSTHDRALAQDYADILYELKEGSLYEVAQSRL